MRSVFLKKYKDDFEKKTKLFFELIEDDSKLKKACQYAISNGGKRFRPIIVFLVAEALNKNYDVFYSALSVEFFHTASLIADDLPCMDDEDIRRSKPTLHKVYGEDVALLSSYTLISLGYEMISKNTKVLIEDYNTQESKACKLCYLALERISKAAGIDGATMGQFMDLHPKDRSFETIYKIIELKTAVLFEIAFLLGWLFGGGDENKIDAVIKASYHFGIAFQIADDLLDYDEDEKNGNINLAIETGKEKAFDLFNKEISLFQKQLIKLNLQTKAFEKICQMLTDSISKEI